MLKETTASALEDQIDAFLTLHIVPIVFIRLTDHPVHV